jgi:hypothetical protein
VVPATLDMLDTPDDPDDPDDPEDPDDPDDPDDDWYRRPLPRDNHHEFLRHFASS